VDDEGVAARPLPLLRDGRVRVVLTDRRTAGAESNGHGRVPDFRRPPRARLSNLVVSPGRASYAELLERCGAGIAIGEISAGFADPQSGRFRFVVESGQTVRKGKAGSPTGRFVLAGDVLTALHALDETRGAEALPATGLGLCVKGGDEVPVGGVAPAILVRGLTARPLPR
jgi:predicted Zn-dependent protease